MKNFQVTTINQNGEGQKTIEALNIRSAVQLIKLQKEEAFPGKDVSSEFSSNQEAYIEVRSCYNHPSIESIQIELVSKA